MPKARVSARTPVEAYFWLDFRRRWTVRRILAMAAVLLAVVAIQTAITWGTTNPTTLQSPLGTWGMDLAARLYLMNSWGLLLSPDRSLYSQPAWVIVWFLVSGVVTPLLALIMPAVLSTSIAAEREQSRLEDVNLTMLTPADILLAKGLSCALPFLVLAIVYTVVDVISLFLVRVPAMQAVPMSGPVANLMLGGSTDFSRKLYVFSLFVSSVLTPVLLSIRAAILVCASALCRRVATALVVGFVVVIIAEPLLSAAIGWGISAVTPPERSVRGLLKIALRIVTEFAALQLILPYAIQAIDPSSQSEPAEALSS